jgi:hypothetical protein
VTDTIAGTDCNPLRVGYTGTAAVAVTLPTATTLAVPKCAFRLVNNTKGPGGTVTVTPTTWTCTVNGAAPTATCPIPIGQIASFGVDPASATNWIVDITPTSTAQTPVRGISFTIGDPAASAALTVSSTTTDYLTIPFSCTIQAYNLAIDAGTITVKFWKIATGTAIPSSGNSINTSGVAIASGTAIHSATLSDFTTTAVAANDIMAMNVTAVATAKYVTGTLQCQ